MKSPSRQAFDKKYPQWAAELEMDEAGSISSLDSITARHSFRVWDEAWKQCANTMYGVLQESFKPPMYAPKTVFKPGILCTVNGNGDLGMIHQAKPFIHKSCIIVKKCRSGLIQVALESDPRQMYSVPESNIDLTSCRIDGGNCSCEFGHAV